MTRRRMTTSEIEAAIELGALYADVHHGKWSTIVKIEKIDVSSPQTSVMAQLAGEDWDERFPYAEAVKMGFILPIEATPAEREFANKIWRVKTRQRRPARVGRPPKNAPKDDDSEE